MAFVAISGDDIGQRVASADASTFASSVLASVNCLSGNRSAAV
jgi:hypothetical protein